MDITQRKYNLFEHDNIKVIMLHVIDDLNLRLETITTCYVVVSNLNLSKTLICKQKQYNNPFL